MATASADRPTFPSSSPPSPFYSPEHEGGLRFDDPALGIPVSHEDDALRAVVLAMEKDPLREAEPGVPLQLSVTPVPSWVAPTAPMAPPSVGVASPTRIVPSTMKISTIDGTCEVL